VVAEDWQRALRKHGGISHVAGAEPIDASIPLSIDPESIDPERRRRAQGCWARSFATHNAGTPFTLSAPYLPHEIPDQFDV
jgi:hypothetical protein